MSLLVVMNLVGFVQSGLNRELFAYDYGDEDSDQRPSPTDSTPTKPAQQPVAPPIEENKDVTSAIARCVCMRKQLDFPVGIARFGLSKNTD